MDDGVIEINCETLDEFWNVMSPIGKWFDGQNGQFVFRGQRDSTRKLIPKVYRRNVIEQYKLGMMKTLTDHPGQTVFEWSLLENFMFFCDARGLAVPGDSMDFRKYFSFGNITTLHGMNTDTWPQEAVLPLMALAQHHGIPTRLLDWSNNPYVACYFAAESAVSSEKGCDRIAVFALDLMGLYTIPEVRHIRVPGSTSANLSSQGGSFLLIGNSGFRGMEFTPEVSLESKIVSEVRILTKVTLPNSLAGDLLHRCHKFGISAASIYPGYDGAAKAVLEWTRALDFTNRQTAA